jgi:hypothetical protein
MVWSNKDYKVSILASSVVDREPWSGLTKTKVSILASSVVDREPWSGLAKTIKLASLPQVW